MCANTRALLILLLLFTAGTVRAQEQTVRFPGERVTVETLMEAVHRQTPYVFAYERRSFDISREIVLPASVLSVKQALDALVQGTDFSYLVQGDFIVINSSARPKRENTSRTQDIYRPGTPEELADLYRALERDTTVLPLREGDSLRLAPMVLPETPESRSDYSELDLYEGLKKKQPRWSLKTNLLYAAAALAPNLAVEAGLGPKTSLELSASYNGWNRRGTMADNRKMVHYTIRPEFRYWLCERNNGHFFGAHAFYTLFNVSEHEIPFAGFKKRSRYEGDAWGIGVTYGYHLPLGKRWGAEFNIGLGAAYLDYDQFDCTRCTRPDKHDSKFYFGPTRASVSLVFLIK